jgi:hypothetical protein
MEEETGTAAAAFVASRNDKIEAVAAGFGGGAAMAEGAGTAAAGGDGGAVAMADEA